MAWRRTWNEPTDERPGFLADKGGMFPPGVKLVLILTVGVFILQVLSNAALMAYGALSVDALLHLEVWRLVTYMFLHGSPSHIFWNMFIFWMLGSVFERQIGTKQFLALYLSAGVVGGASEAVFNSLMALRTGSGIFLTMPAVGASAGVMGILVAFAVLNPRAKFLIFFILPVEAWWVAIAYGVVETWPIITDLFLRPTVWTDNVAHAAHLGGMVLGFVWMKWSSRAGLWWRQRASRVQPGYRMQEPDEEEAELDRILDKIHEQGIDSLTLRERMFLQEVSRRHQNRRGGPD